MVKLSSLPEDFNNAIGMSKVNDGMLSGKDKTMTSVIGRGRDRKSRGCFNVGKDTICPRVKIPVVLMYFVIKVIESYHDITSKVMLIFEFTPRFLVPVGDGVFLCSFVVTFPSHFREKADTFSDEIIVGLKFFPQLIVQNTILFRKFGAACIYT